MCVPDSLPDHSTIADDWMQVADTGSKWYFYLVTAAQRKLLQNVVRDGLKIQHRFSAAPVYALTGKGHLKSEGVKTLQKIKSSLKRRRETGVA
jgi:hypothetical protein